MPPPTAHEIQDGDFTLSDDPTRFDLPRAHGWIGGQSYWAEGIPLATLAKACANSLTVGAYGPDGDMVAMARVVTDRATFGWVCDVFVGEAARGHGLGKRLMAYLKAHPDLQGLRRLHLATRDAHGLYAQFGFGPLTAPETWMEIRDPDVYRRGERA
ncbi:MAG: GNAT family N-acetyltransferase [Caulobacterales bacterium]|nr:GNAT family N-acetyltransferase [Caulobacterales bacterium]